MSLDLNDPRLTAYALNELDPREREEMEKLIANDPAAQELVNDLCDTAAFLQLELGAEPAPELESTQKEAIRNGQVESKIVPFPVVTESGDSETPTYADKDKIIPFPFVKYVAWGCGIAATVAFAVGLAFPSLQGAMGKRRPTVASMNFESGYIANSPQVATAEPAQDIMYSIEEKRSEENAPLPPPTPAELSAAKQKMEVFVVDASTSTAAPYMPEPTVQPAPQQAPASVAVASRRDARSKEARNIIASGGPATPLPPGTVTTLGENRTRIYVTKSKSGLLPSQPSAGNESYSAITENEFLFALDNPLSTFSIDVDTASYANVRRFLEQGQRPPADAVRIEEMVNYFPYNYAQPEGNDPFAANVEIADCPWDREHRLVRVGLKGREIAQNNRPASNLVFLIDVSGSMNEPAKLPLVKASLQLLVNKLTARDRIAIVVYAGNSGLVLRSTSITSANKAGVLDTLDRLEAGGSTNGGEGIQLAYAVAREHFIKGGTNRVILCTDGDYNVGVTSQSELVDLIKQEAKSGVFLSVFGFGSGNLKDSTMMNLADKGNGNYAYIDSLKEGRKVFVEQMSGTLVTIAKDVKIQIEFNPAKVGAYRLIGYEKRMLAKEDFNNDKKDAGEIGAGHTVTALYEIIPAGKPVKPAVDALKYQANPPTRVGVDDLRSVSDDLLTLKIRYKQPDGATSKKLEFPIRDQGAKLESASGDFKFAASVAAFGMILRDSQLRGEADYALVLKLAREGKGEDEEGYRSEFIRLVKTAAEMGK